VKYPDPSHGLADDAVAWRQLHAPQSLPSLAYSSQPSHSVNESLLCSFFKMALARIPHLYFKFYILLLFNKCHYTNPSDPNHFYTSDCYSLSPLTLTLLLKIKLLLPVDRVVFKLSQNLTSTVTGYLSLSLFFPSLLVISECCLKSLSFHFKNSGGWKTPIISPLFLSIFVNSMTVLRC